jgi:hypothetical protein
MFWRTADYNNTDMDLAKVVARVTLAAVGAADQIAGSGQFYYANPLAQSIEYIDEDHSGKIHVSLINRDAVSKKNTAAEGTIQLTAGTAGSQFTSVEIDGVTITSAAVAFNASIDQTIADLKTNVDAFTGTSGWTSGAATDTLTVTAVDDSLLGSVGNGLVITNTLTGDFATTLVNTSGGLGDVVITLGCTPYFS